MAKTIRIASTEFMHTPGMFNFVRRGVNDKKWQREAFGALGLCPEAVKAIMDGNACCEVDSEDETVQLITVADAVYAKQLEFQLARAKETV